MSQKVLNCLRFTFAQQPQKVHLLLSSVAVSIIWILAVNEASLAQVDPNQQEAKDFQLSNTNLLPVPQSSIPKGQSVPKLQTVPPPPTADGMGMPAAGYAYAPLVNPIPKAVQQQPVNNLQQQETSFIQQQVRPRSVTLQIPKPTNVIRTAADGETSDLGLGLLRQVDSSPAASLPPFASKVADQEFSAPTAPTFNQLLNSQAAPLPPLPDTNTTPQSNVTTATPTFNQLLTPPTSVSPTQPKTITSQQHPVFTSRALREPFLQLQGVYVTQGGDTSARARVTGVYPLSPQALVGATLDLTSQGSSFDDSRREGLNINELYLATSIAGIPNLRFVVGQIDLTSYFDRNSFAKDGASQFFNPVFQTNPALAATGIASRPALLVNWSVTDNIEAKAAVFSSADKISDFSLDGFAGEVAVRYGNAIIRGTYASDRDAGVRDSFAESYSIARGNNEFGPIKTDREEAYGLNAEVFIPNLKLGVFGRYGRYENRDLGQGADTYILGASLLDLFTRDDRLGLAYGRALSSDRLRRGDRPDVLELYYDFQLIPNLRLGFTVQGRDNFSETVVGVRVKSEFDVTPSGRVAR
ncbi:carbohydrate porin [Nostoc sp. 106C]|uniref:carbohydrate porin n=1 Tax=Nostoc sp. 106C TaxID=1932667 RepID=UPI000A39B616|nr:carbohydrate porin [Nostoc sp. 106C]OUL22013.1 porin [Nostoc sp. 106C]